MSMYASHSGTRVPCGRVDENRRTGGAHVLVLHSTKLKQ
jgi:hypothetical protein